MGYAQGTVRVVHHLFLTGLALILVSCTGALRPGERWVNDIRVEGNNAVSSASILSGLETQETAWWPWAKKRFYDPLVLDVDIDRIEAYYATRGFFSARVVEHEVVSRDEASVNIVFAVEEGPPAIVRNISFDGLPQVSGLDRRLARRIGVRADRRFEYAAYQESKTALRRALREIGYAYARVDGEVAVDRQEGTAGVIFRLDPGPLVHFGETRLAGAGTLPQAKILRLVAWDAGDPFSPQAIAQTQARLVALRVFSSVRIALPDQPTAVADVDITVEPGKLRELRLGGGIGIQLRRFEVRARADWTIYNFLGGLRTLSVQVRPAFVTIPSLFEPQRIGPALTSKVQLTQPDIFETAITAFGLIGYELSLEEGYRYHGPRMQYGLERSFFHDRLRFGPSWNLELFNFFDINQEAFDPSQTPLGLAFVDPYRLTWFEEFIALDLRDAALDPRAGLYLLGRAEQGFPQIGSAFTYLKFRPEARTYLPLGTKRLVFAARGMMGYLWTKDGQESPVTRRFRLGGPNDHRGFSFGRLSPQSFDSTGNRIPTGGNAAVLFSGDLRFRLLKLWGNWLNLSGFVDGGDVTVAFADIDLGNLHWASGGELQYQTPLGALRLAVGARFTRVNEDPTTLTPDPGDQVVFHFALGDAF